MPAELILFAYKRADHLQRTLDSLAANAEAQSSSITIYCDAARAETDRVAVDEVRAVARAENRFADVTLVKQSTNLGLARSIIAGVTETLARTDRVIVLEDDLLLSPHFLRFMNDGLDRYSNDDRVASIHGYCYPVPTALPETFFLRGADCWGWATWRDAWALFEQHGEMLLQQLEARSLTHIFDLDGAYPFTQMLRDQVAGNNDSWAIRWHAACFLAGRLTLYPGRTLVHNLGNDGTGTHGHNRGIFDGSVASEPIAVKTIEIEESAPARAAFATFLRPTLIKRIVRAALHRVKRARHINRQTP